MPHPPLVSSRWRVPIVSASSSSSSSNWYSDFLLSLQISFAPGNYKYTWNFQYTRNFQHTPALSWSNFLHARKSFRDEGQTVLDEGQTSWHVSRYLQVYPGTYRYIQVLTGVFRNFPDSFANVPGSFTNLLQSVYWKDLIGLKLNQESIGRHSNLLVEPPSYLSLDTGLRPVLASNRI